MAFSPKEQEIIKWGQANGKSQAEVKDAITKLRTGYVPPATETPTKTPAPSYIDQVGDAAKSGVEKIQEGFKQAEIAPGKSPLDAFESGIKTAQGGIETLFSPIAPVFSEFNKFLEGVSSKIAESGAVQDFANSDIGKVMARIAEDLGGLSTIAGFAVGGKGAPKVATAVKTAAEGAGEAVATTVDDAYQSALNVRKNVQTAIGKETVDKQLKSSAERLFLDGTDRIADPIATYNKFVNQSKEAIGDIKKDPPISVVGESIGDAFKSVIAQRRAVGATMASELKKVGKIKTDVLPVVDTLVKDFAEEGLAYDRVKKQLIQKTKQTKMTTEDLSLLETYANELQKLGSKPTIADLDAFLSRIPKEIDVYKASKNLIGSTNAERIIKKSLSNLREQFDPVKSGNASLKGYADARSAYSDLSGFIEEGAPFLGKVTQAGDFAKDASLAKSAVQSVLNNGKKDWLVRLEALTGYPALDEAVLALQAMKDAGDFRGASLLQSMSEGAIPTSKAGFTQAILDFALSTGQKLVAGTPEEQTRAFLADLAKKAKK